MEPLLAAINTGDFHSAIWAGIVLLLSNYAVDVGKNLIASAVKGLHYLSDRAAEQDNQFLANIEQRLLDKVGEAVEGMMPLAEDLKRLSSDGKLTKEDMSELQGKAFQLFIDNLTPKDWIAFGEHLIDGGKKNAPREFTEARLEKRFKALHDKALSRVKVEKKSRELMLGNPELLKKSLGLS